MILRIRNPCTVFIYLKCVNNHNCPYPCLAFVMYGLKFIFLGDDYTSNRIRKRDSMFNLAQDEANEVLFMSNTYGTCFKKFPLLVDYLWAGAFIVVVSYFLMMTEDTILDYTIFVHIISTTSTIFIHRI